MARHFNECSKRQQGHHTASKSTLVPCRQFRMDAPSIAPSGIALYSGELFPQWQGDILIGALVNNEVRRGRLSNHGREASDVEGLFGELDERIRDVRVRPRR